MGPCGQTAGDSWTKGERAVQTDPVTHGRDKIEVENEPSYRKPLPFSHTAVCGLAFLLSGCHLEAPRAVPGCRPRLWGTARAGRVTLTPTPGGSALVIPI